MKEWEAFLIGTLKSLESTYRNSQANIIQCMISQFGPLSDEAAEKVRKLLEEVKK